MQFSSSMRVGRLAVAGAAALGFGLTVLGPTTESRAALVQPGDAADFERNEDGTAAQQTIATFRAGASTSAGGGRNGIFAFDLAPFVAQGQPLTSADLRLTLATRSGAPTFNVDLYGVGYSASAAAIPAAADYYEGVFGADTTNVSGLAPLMDNFVPASPTPANNAAFATDATADTALVAFINARPAGQDFVWFRVSPDVDPGSAAPIGYNFHSATATTADFRPQLGLNQQVPEPAAAGLLAAGAIGLLARCRRRA